MANEPTTNLERQLAFGTLRRHSDELLIQEILKNQTEMRNDIRALQQRVNILFGALGVLTVLANFGVGYIVTSVLK
jgi:hypothetical protein